MCDDFLCQFMLWIQWTWTRKKMYGTCMKITWNPWYWFLILYVVTLNTKNVWFRRWYMCFVCFEHIFEGFFLRGMFCLDSSGVLHGFRGKSDHQMKKQCSSKLILMFCYVCLNRYSLLYAFLLNYLTRLSLVAPFGFLCHICGALLEPNRSCQALVKP